MLGVALGSTEHQPSPCTQSHQAPQKGCPACWMLPARPKLVPTPVPTWSLRRPLVRSRPPPDWSTSVNLWNALTTRPSLVFTTPWGFSLSPAAQQKYLRQVFCSAGTLCAPQDSTQR